MTTLHAKRPYTYKCIGDKYPRVGYTDDVLTSPRDIFDTVLPWAGPLINNEGTLVFIVPNDTAFEVTT